MRLPLVYSIFFIFSLIGSAAVLNPTWPSENNVLFSDTELSSDQSVSPLDRTPLLFDLAEVPPKSDFSSLDASEDFFEEDRGNSNSNSNSHSTNDILSPLTENDETTSLSPFSEAAPIFDDSFAPLAFNVDCHNTPEHPLPSSLFPLVGKWRVRQRFADLDESENCQEQDATLALLIADDAANNDAGGRGEISDLSDLGEQLLDSSRPILHVFREGKVDRSKQNSFCYLYTKGDLPIGVCSSGEPDDQTPSTEQFDIPRWNAFNRWELNYGSISMLLFFLIEFSVNSYASVFLSFIFSSQVVVICSAAIFFKSLLNLRRFTSTLVNSGFGVLGFIIS